MPNLLKSQPGETVVCEGPDGLVMGVGRDSGTVRTLDGKSFSAGAYDIVNRVNECDACGSDEFNLINGTEQLVCTECGQRHE